MRYSLLGSFMACVLITACETPAPIIMDPVAYQSDYMRAQSSGSIIHAEALLSQLLERTDLSTDQRADAYLLRANMKRQFNYDLPGALVDYQSYLDAQPEGFEAADIRAEMQAAEAEVRAAQSRLSGLQTLSQWFSDMLIMGQLEQAAERQKKSKITPTDHHTYILREAGYICTGPSQTPSIHTYGDEPEYARGLVWCESGEVS